MSGNLSYAQAEVKILWGANAIFGIGEENNMNLSLLQRPKKIKPGTKTMYVYHPAVVTTSSVLEPGAALKVLDVFEGATTSQTTLKVMTADDWDMHKWGRDGLEYCTIGESERKKCECQKELSEMSENLRERVHYVLLSDVGK
jgi:hypothetical protein